MKNKTIGSGLFILFLLCANLILKANPYPDQFFTIYSADSLLNNIEEASNIIKSTDNISLELAQGQQEGYFILEPYTFDFEFNRGLPSWNGTAPDEQSAGFKVEMRFFINNQWSDWVMVGFWDNYIWGTYGKTEFSDGRVDIDYIKLYSYCTTFQYKVTLKRSILSYDTPKIRKLSFSVSDSQTPVNIDDVIADNPEEFFIPTDFVYQYGVDDEIGGSICSPTSVSMILKSFDIEVDPYSFAQRTFDPYWDIFGVWPRVVTHASEYGLKGAVTRYRTWSETLEVMKNGGRIAMSVGEPLYSGHLIMLAGFNSEGIPIVHDPAKTYGENYKYSKQSISESWFNKGGISYTFYLDENYTDIEQLNKSSVELAAYPNPGIYHTKLTFSLNRASNVTLSVYDIRGQLVKNIHSGYLTAGIQEFDWNFNASQITKGMYIARLTTQSSSKAIKLMLNPY